MLRPFLDAYRLVGEQLADAEDDRAIDPETVVRDCLRLGHQWSLQRTLASEESVSGEMFRTALKLAEELREVSRDIGRIAALAPDATG